MIFDVRNIRLLSVWFSVLNEEPAKLKVRASQAIPAGVRLDVGIND